MHIQKQTFGQRASRDRGLWCGSVWAWGRGDPGSQDVWQEDRRGMGFIVRRAGGEEEEGDKD